jgi:hypothetical protein
MTSSVHRPPPGRRTGCPSPGASRWPGRGAACSPVGPAHRAGLGGVEEAEQPKATAWPRSPAGITSHSTSQKATTSSQTMAPGSARAQVLRRAGAGPPAQQQAGGDQPAPLPRWSASGRAPGRLSQAHSVPTVPGAQRRQAAAEAQRHPARRVAHMKRAVGAGAVRGRTVQQRSCEVVEAAEAARHAGGPFVQQPQAGPAVDAADARDATPPRGPRPRTAAARPGRGGEQQFVVVAAGQQALLLQAAAARPARRCAAVRPARPRAPTPERCRMWPRSPSRPSLTSMALLARPRSARPSATRGCGSSIAGARSRRRRPAG